MMMRMTSSSKSSWIWWNWASRQPCSTSQRMTEHRSWFPWRAWMSLYLFYFMKHHPNLLEKDGYVNSDRLKMFYMWFWAGWREIREIVWALLHSNLEFGKGLGLRMLLTPHYASLQYTHTIDPPSKISTNIMNYSCCCSCEIEHSPSTYVLAVPSQLY